MKKAFAAIVLFILFTIHIVAQQNVGIGTATPHASAALDISSTSKGVLVPRMTSVQRNAILSPARGLMVFDNDFNSYWYYAGAGWIQLGGNTFSSDSSLVIGQQTGTVNSYNLITNMSRSDSSGYLYDSGGPAGNYGNNENFIVTLNNLSNQVAVDLQVISNSLESPYDSLIISDDNNNKYILLGNALGAYRLFGQVTIRFKTNFANNLAGFAIHWNKLFLAVTDTYDSTQLTGWYFNREKLYMRGGINTGNQWSPDSSGLFSFSYGDNAQAKGRTSFAAGYNAKATGDNSSISMGWQTIASGLFGSVAIGDQAKATGPSGATALGSHTLASGLASTALGYYSEASGDGSTALGADTKAIGNISTALGTDTKAIGSVSTALGSNTTADGDISTALGFHTTASGDMSVALGFSTKSKSFAGLVTGSYNDSTNAPSPFSSDPLNRLFQIGNGTADNARSNAMTVLQNGNVGIGILAPAQKLEVNGNVTVQNGKGLIRNIDGTQLKKLSSSVTVNASFAAGQTQTFAINFPESFSITPEVYLGNVVSGAGGWAELVMTIALVTTTGATLYVFNPRAIVANPNFTIKVIAMGPQ